MAAPLSFDSAYRTLKRDTPAPVYYLTGDEDMLKQELVDLVVSQTVDPAGRDFNLDIRSAADLNGEGFHTLVETPPMLAERRAVVIHNIGQWRRNAKVWQVVYRYVENPSPTTVLVLVTASGEKPDKRLAQATTHIAVQPLNPDRLRRWIGVRSERAGFGMTDGAAQHLLKAVGSDLSALAMEIEKLAAIAQPGIPVDADDVAQLVGIRRGETPQDWVDAVLLRDILRAAEMLEPVLATAGVTGVRILMALGSGLVGVRLARALIDEGLPLQKLEREIFNAIRICRPAGLTSWKDAARLWASAARQWSSGEIEEALRLAYQCDRSLKSTTLSDARGTILDLLLSLSPIVKAAA
ncbi:MAG: DNA polymerase III subunit delta [Gemmatimonadota bacterium]|nr:MAG: DNA polymerase III subunit delta [Gemmatimonadota bacterium]